MKLLVTIIMLAMLGGCATYKEQRQLLLNPQRANEGAASSPGDVAQQGQIAAYYKAMSRATTNYDQDPPKRASFDAVALYVEEGISLNTAFCRRWFHRIDDAERQFAIGSKDVNIITSLGTTLLGLANASATAVAVYGAGLTAMNGFGDNFQSQLLTAPSQKGVEAKVMQMLDSYGEQLRADAPRLSFPAAFTRLEAMADLCTFSAIRDAVDQSLKSTEAVVSKSGAVTISATTTSSSYQKDDSGDRIIAFWMQGGKVNVEHDFQLKAWMTAHGMDTSVPYFAHAKLYEAARKQAVTDLAIPGSP